MRLNSSHSKFFIVSVVAILFIAFCGYSLEIKKKPGPCDGRQWKNPAEELACKFPSPPIGRWKAVYTREFANQYNLPTENISTDISLGVDYMEMDVQPYNNAAGTACIVNMLVKRPNDISFYNIDENTFHWAPEFNEHRTLAHLVELEKSKTKLKQIDTFGLAPRNMKYDATKNYGVGDSFAFYAENVLDGYDYISANAGCYWLLSNPSRFPDGWAFNFAKASIWGKYKTPYEIYDDPQTPKGKAVYDSLGLIDIPHELIVNIFIDMPIGGQ